jgi:hypothetical protein
VASAKLAKMSSIKDELATLGALVLIAGQRQWSLPIPAGKTA